MNDVLELINRRQRQILVHSFLYYQLNENIISDYTFDMWAKELAELMKNHHDLAKKSVYYEAFKEFEGSTGFDLPYANPEIQKAGFRLLSYHKKLKGN